MNIEYPAIQSSNLGTQATYNIGSANWSPTSNLSNQFTISDALASNIKLDAYMAQRASEAETKTVKRKDKVSARLVRIFVIDPDENIPLEKRVIYKSEETLTDLTNEELWMTEVPVKSLLDNHNIYRATVKHKKQSANKDKDIMLEPAKVRDLRMTVVDIVSF